jgi:adenosylmethionine---8-amino-7-oxononanoate aminotransferase
MLTRDELLHYDRRLVWHAFTQMAEYEPLVFERAEGCTLYDIDGRAYLDGVSSLWCNIHGHRHPRIDEAIRRQLDKVAHVTNLGSSNPTTIELAKRLVDFAPPGLGHVFFSDDGATAVEVALKMAFQYWRLRGLSPFAESSEQKGTVPLGTPVTIDDTKKRLYVALDGAYHGDTLGSVSVGGVERFHAMFRPLMFDVLRLPAPDTYRLPPGVSLEGAAAYYLSQLEELLAARHEAIAAVVVEPLVQAAAGIVMHPAGYLRGVRELTRRYDVLLIADEVAVAFGRTGTMFACEHEDVSPDFLCLAKGLTGGYLPLAATLTTDEVWNAFLGSYAEGKTFFHGHTYGGNPLGAAAALATLDIFAEEETLVHLQPKIARLAEHLQRIARLPHVGDVRQRGLIAGIELVRDTATKEPYPWAERRGQRVCGLARGEGVLLRPLGNVIVIMPPLSITLDELDRICLAVGRGIPAATAD